MSLGSDSIIYYTMCEEQQAEYGRFRKWGPSFISYDGWALNGGTEDWSWSDSATYRLYCVITELGASMWESDAAAKVTAEKMLGADMYMIKCAGFYPMLQEVTVVDDGAGCNNDGVLNPGETVTLIAEADPDFIHTMLRWDVKYEFPIKGLTLMPRLRAQYSFNNSTTDKTEVVELRPELFLMSEF